MQFDVKIDGLSECLCSEQIDENYDCLGHFKEKRVVVEDERLGILTDDQVSLGNMLIARCDFQLKSDLHIEREFSSDLIQLYFSLEGSSSIQFKGSKAVQFFDSGEHNICYLPPSKSYLTNHHKNGIVDIFIVTMPVSVYFRLIPAQCELHRSFAKNVMDGKADYLNDSSLPVTSAMLSIIREIRNCTRTGLIKRLFLEARVTELLMLQLEHANLVPKNCNTLKVADREKVLEARQFLDENFNHSPTIAELSRIVGLNEFKLKRGFREVFGNSILGYVNNLRMEHARMLIEEGDLTLADISYRIGYKNASHFTVAFKKQFGILPSEIRE